MWLYPGLWTYGPEAGWYLSFDDGPNPETTPKLLAWLAKQQIVAQFFISGEAAKAFPELVKELHTQGHLVGFHGHRHENAFWKSKAWAMHNFSGTDFHFFRAPYGKIWPWQFQKLKSLGQWVHWSLMTYDFLPLHHPKAQTAVLRKKLLRAKPGSIFVLHDSPKAAPHLFAHLALIQSVAQEKNLPFLRLDRGAGA